MKEDRQHMDEEAYRVAYLIAGFIRNTLTVKEHDELDEWVNASDHNMKLFEELTDEENLEANLSWMDSVQTEKSWQALQEAGAFNKPARIKKFHAWMAAASILLIAGLFTVNYLRDADENGHRTSAIKSDVPPGGNRATLTLSDGSVIDLAKARDGLLENDKGVEINKQGEGQLLYSANGNVSVGYNTLSTPRGGQYNVVLPDGSRVWLNAASSLKYPTAFQGTTRVVELTGEGYFEVAKNTQDFIVKLANESQVKVLGTWFNVNSYEDEESQEITLLEGSVQIIKGNEKQLLQPGQQARVSKDDILRIAAVNTEETTGWKNGQFVFRDADIQSIMRQVVRWYDVKVIYQTGVTRHFNATISRNEPLSRLLNLLEKTGDIHFKIENKTIYVLP